MASISEVVGRNDLPMVHLFHSVGTECEVYLHGATITGCSLSGRQIIFVSESAIFDGRKAIRGGIPVVFPQFGQPNTAMPAHGIARTNQWHLASTSLDEPDDSISATLVLRDNDSTRHVFPHAFELMYRITLNSQELRCQLVVTNTDDLSPFHCHTLLHTYFSISDISNVTARGFAGCDYLDKLLGMQLLTEDRENITIDRETDRIYKNSGHQIPDIVIHDSNQEGDLRITKSACYRNRDDTEAPISCDTVLWNPWIEKAKQLSDLGDEEYHNFVCVEPGTVSEWVVLQPRQSMELSQRIVLLQEASEEESKH